MQSPSTRPGEQSLALLASMCDAMDEVFLVNDEIPFSDTQEHLSTSASTVPHESPSSSSDIPFDGDDEHDIPKDAWHGEDGSSQLCVVNMFF